MVCWELVLSTNLLRAGIIRATFWHPVAFRYWLNTWHLIINIVSINLIGNVWLYNLELCLQYGINIIIIVGAYIFIVQTVFKHEEELRKQAKKMNVPSLRSNSEQQVVSSEIRAAKIAIVNVCLWIFAWTPFTAIAMVGVWYDASFISPLISELQILCAKTSAVYNPIVYALSHPKYREVILHFYTPLNISEILWKLNNFIISNHLSFQCLKEMYPWVCIVIDKKATKKHGDESRSFRTENTSIE